MNEIMSKLSWVDLFIAIGFLRGCYVGYKSGLLPEILRLITYTVAALSSYYFRDSFAQYLTLNTFLNLSTANVVGFACIFIGTFILLKLLSMLLLKVFKVGEGNFIYNFLGMVLGAGRWLVLLSAIFFVVNMMSLSLKKDIQGSTLGPKVTKITPMLFDFVSGAIPELAARKK